MDKSEIIARINLLKKEKNAVIIAHYYSLPEVQDVSDILGDSLALSKAAAETNADIILFCGVNFMAETASIISPDKRVIVPDNRAGCSLAASIKAHHLISWKEANPDGIIVSYVNTTAEVKAYTDICCTSANALKIIESITADKKILFTPDKNLGKYLKIKTGRDIEIWEGSCCVHNKFDSQMIINKMKKFPEADILIHPESFCSDNLDIINDPRVFFYSTSGMVDHIVKSSKSQFVIATEKEIIHEMKKRDSSKEYIPVSGNALCGNMKRATLEKVLLALETEQPEIKVKESVRAKAILSINRMFEII
jgi:quinolinate synthase